MSEHMDNLARFFFWGGGPLSSEAVARTSNSVLFSSPASSLKLVDPVSLLQSSEGLNAGSAHAYVVAASLDMLNRFRFLVLGEMLEWGSGITVVTAVASRKCCSEVSFAKPATGCSKSGAKAGTDTAAPIPMGSWQPVATTALFEFPPIAEEAESEY